MSSKEKKLAAAAEEAKKSRKFTRNCIIFIVVLAIVVAAAALINSNISTTKTTAIEIGGTKYSPAEFSYYYRSSVSTTYTELYNYYGDMASYMLNTATSLEEQTSMYGDGEQSWADYFYNDAVIAMTNVTVLYDAAMKEGYTLSDEDKAAIEADIDYYEQTALSNNYPDLNSFLATNFGKGFDEDMLRTIAEKQYIAAAYSADLSEGIENTAEEKETYYAENANSFDFVKYHFYFVSTGNEAFAELSEEERATAAHDAAAVIADAASGAQFTNNVHAFVPEASKSVYEAADSTLNINQGGNISSIYRDWLMDAERVEGDTTVIDSEGGSFALMFVSRNDNHYELVDVRHILISAEADENGKFTEEALEVAKAEAERVYALWQEDPTEENFAALAEEYSSDESSSTNGGLYREVYQNAMVKEFNDFLFNEGKQPGDHGIVYGSNGSYAGYHIMYFSALGEMFSNVLADNSLRAEKYNEIVSAMAENYGIEVGSGMKYVNLA